MIRLKSNIKCYNFARIRAKDPAAGRIFEKKSFIFHLRVKCIRDKDLSNGSEYVLMAIVYGNTPIPLSNIVGLKTIFVMKMKANKK